MRHSLSPDPDELLRAAVLFALSAHGLGPADLHVGVVNGIVHLAGRVDSLGTRGAAEELAQAVPGVRGVVNRIEAPGAPSPTRIINLDLTETQKNTKSND